MKKEQEVAQSAEGSRGDGGRGRRPPCVHGDVDKEKEKSARKDCEHRSLKEKVKKGNQRIPGARAQAKGLFYTTWEGSKKKIGKKG